MKRTMSILLLLLLSLSLFPAALAEEVFISGDYKYSINDDGSATIEDWSGDDTTLEIPEELDGHTVTAIGDSVFSHCRLLSQVSIPDSVTAIGDKAFLFCDYLRQISIPDSVTAIGEDAFRDCPEKLTLAVERDSYAAAYAKANGLNYVYPDTNDWLNS